MPLTRGQQLDAAAGVGAVTEKVMTFAGGTTNDPGDFDGTGNPATLFTVTGTVLMKLFATCGVNLAGASATIAVGTANITAGEITYHCIWKPISLDGNVVAA